MRLACVALVAAAGCLVRLAEGDYLDGSVSKKNTVRSPWRGFSLTSPDPSLLVWDKGASAWDGVWFLEGWLKVPLAHDAAPEDLPPHVCLRVLAYTKSNSPSQGPLLAHCGGPGSGRECAEAGMWDFDGSLSAVSGDFAFLGIDQRGISIDANGNPPANGTCPFRESNGKPVEPFPVIRCSEISDRLAGGDYHEQASRLQEMFADFAGETTLSEEELDVIFAILREGGIPSDAIHGSAYLNEAYVRWYYRLLSLENNLCASAARFTRDGTAAKSYNVLTFAGTSDLARDIDVFRSAIGAESMSFIGYSYGTLVASTYATIFPERVDRLVLDGVMPPQPDLPTLVSFSSRGIFSTFQGIMSDCSASVSQEFPQEERCPLGPTPSVKVLKMLNDSQDPVKSSIVSNVMYRATTDISSAPRAVDCVAKLFNEEAETQSIPHSCSSGHHHGEEGDVALYSDGSYGFHMGGLPLGLAAAVIGLDFSGRWSEEAFVAWWRNSLEGFPMGTMLGLPVGAGVGSWPIYPKPLAPLGDPSVRAVVIGNLHDFSTDYSGAQSVKAMYPAGALMTWQGYGHCMLSPSSGGEPAVPTVQQENKKALDRCREKVARYLANGELPRDGHVCELDAPLHLGPGACQNGSGCGTQGATEGASEVYN